MTKTYDTEIGFKGKILIFFVLFILVLLCVLAVATGITINRIDFNIGVLAIAILGLISVFLMYFVLSIAVTIQVPNSETIVFINVLKGKKRVRVQDIKEIQYWRIGNIDNTMRYLSNRIKFITKSGTCWTKDTKDVLFFINQLLEQNKSIKYVEKV